MGVPRLARVARAGDGRVRRQHLLRPARARGRHPGRARRGHGHPAARTRARAAAAAADPHRPDPPAPRPPRGPRLLRAALGAGPRDPRLGAVLAGGHPGGADREVPVAAALPVQLAEVPSRLTFHDLPDEEFALGSARFWAEPVSHRGPTVGLRIEEHGRTLVYIPDHEPYLGAGPAGVDPEWLSGYSLAEGATVLMHDAQYFEHEYPNHIGWGHSSVDHAVEFARASRSRAARALPPRPAALRRPAARARDAGAGSLGAGRARAPARLRGHEARARHRGRGRGALPGL